jgi:hypothetical protein
MRRNRGHDSGRDGSRRSSTAASTRPSGLVRLYIGSLRLWRFGFEQAWAAFKGFWLGMLRSEDLHEIDATYYDGQAVLSAGGDYDYRNDEYNQSGLFPWERTALGGSFPSAGNLLVVGAGGGREVVALERMGYRVDSFECHRALVASANDLLRRLDLTSRVQPSPRDGIPDDPGLFATSRYDGLIVGWSAYMLIRGREQRIGLLKQMREHAGPGCPILLSFFVRKGTPRWLHTITRVGNVVALLRGGERVELGDDLKMNFVHRFSRDEIERELDEAGFDLMLFGTDGYGHAVGRSRRDPSAPPKAAAKMLHQVSG